MLRIQEFQFILLLFLFPSGIAQINTCRIYGRVTDSVSLKPISDVSVFIPFTSTGTITNANGEYILDQIPPGLIQLVFRHITYAAKTFEFNIGQQDSIRWDVAMPEVTIEIGEVIRQAGQIEWAYGLILFKELFLGDPYETSCILKNPRDLFFYFDGDVIYGQARQPLKISNSYLGYDITYYLDYFKFDKNKNPYAPRGENEYFAYGGLAFYADKGANARVKKTKWKKNRSAEFQGTLRSFLQEIYQDSVNDRNFNLKEVQAAGSDSIFHWEMGQLKGRFIRYNRDKVFPARDSVMGYGPGRNQKSLRLPGPMLVFYKHQNSTKIIKERVCLLDLDQGTLIFDGNGNYHMENGTLNWVYLDNLKRLRNMLPLDYSSQPASNSE
jgi:hypothetical protein